MAHWKAVERAIATYFGGERVPITGRQRGDAPDIEHPWISFEVKHRKKLPDWLHDAMDQAEASAVIGEEGEDKLPVVVLHEKGRHHCKDFVVMRARDFRFWFGD